MRFLSWIAVMVLCGTTIAAPAQEDAPRDVGVFLDQALADCLKGNTALAEQTFALIEREFSPPPGIRMLIGLIRSENCQPRDPIQSYFPDFISLQAGRTSNANQGPNVQSIVLDQGGTPLTLDLGPSMLPVADSFLGLEGSKAMRLGETSARLSLYGFAREFRSAHDFDQLFANASLVYPWHFGNLDFDAAVSASTMQLGGHHYYQSGGISGTLRKNNLSADMMLMKSRYPVNTAFDSTLAQARIGWDPVLANGWRLRSRLGWLLDRADSTRPGGDRRGWTSSLSLNIPLADRNMLEFDFRLDRSASDQAYLAGLFDMHRIQRLRQIGATWSRPIGAQSSLELTLRGLRSDDSVPFLGYRQYTGIVSWVKRLR